jgi:hypothetical protein
MFELSKNLSFKKLEFFAYDFLNLIFFSIL